MPACYIGGQVKLPEGSVREFWWKNCHCDSFYQQADRLPAGPDVRGWFVAAMLLEVRVSTRSKSKRYANVKVTIIF
jgi:hypothetical protein